MRGFSHESTLIDPKTVPMRRRINEEESDDDSVLVSSDEEGDEQQQLSGDEEDGYGSLEDEVREWRETEGKRREAKRAWAASRRRMSPPPFKTHLLAPRPALFPASAFYLSFSLTILLTFFCMPETQSTARGPRRCPRREGHCRR